MLNRLVCRDAEAEVSTTGAAVVCFRWHGRRILAEWPPGAPSYNGAVLVPWPNRVGEGRWLWKGVTHQLPINEPVTGSALHGLVHSAEFTLTRRDAVSVTLTHTLRPSDGYPFTLDVDATYALTPETLGCEVVVTNVGEEAAPVGIGSHPYLDPGGELDEAALQLCATQVVVPDSLSQPVPVGDVGMGFLDRRSLRGVVLDHAFTGLTRAREDWLFGVLVRADGIRVQMRASESARWLMAYTADTQPAPRKRGAIALEPMTCPPEALRDRHADLAVLEPGERHQLTWSLSVQPAQTLSVG